MRAMMLARPLNGVEHLLGNAALERHGTQEALLCGEERLTYEGLAGRVRRASAALVRLGVRPGDRVLFLMRDTPEFAAAWLGAVRCGAVAVALNNKLTETEYRHVLADSGARLAIVEDVFARARPDLNEELVREKRIAIAGPGFAGVPAWRDLAAVPGDVPPFEAAADSPAFYLYSSGTTGRPKGIAHTHRSFHLVGAALDLIGIGAGARVLTTSKFFFAYGLEHGLLGTLARGATSILCPDWPDAAAVLELAARHQPQALFSVPTLYRRLLAEPRARLAQLSGVGRFVSAGERLSAPLASQWREVTGAELLNLYGMSETFCACVVTPPGTSDGRRTGMPLPGVEIRLSDGVLWLKHPGLSTGYVNLPDLTREAFRDGWFCTRDLFTRDAQGHLVHEGRADDLLKIAGQWVQPAEIEAAVAPLDTVAEAVCVAAPDADGLERLALFVIPSGEPDQALRAATAACADLPRHKRPKWIRTVAELPRTATGKVQRFKLRELLAGDTADKG
jgi:3-hydroxybenzoate/4-hydroxybenzoate---CoA ligase